MSENNETLNNNKPMAYDALLGTVLFQICAKGKYANFDGETKYYSKHVYLEKPSQKEIDAFVYKCCNSEHPKNLFDLDIDTVETYILELEVR